MLGKDGIRAGSRQHPREDKPPRAFHRPGTPDEEEKVRDQGKKSGKGTLIENEAFSVDS